MQVMFWIMVCEIDLKILDLKNKETGFEKKTVKILHLGRF
jgi:hypothetical protein